MRRNTIVPRSPPTTREGGRTRECRNALGSLVERGLGLAFLDVLVCAAQPRRKPPPRLRLRPRVRAARAAGAAPRAELEEGADGRLRLGGHDRLDRAHHAPGQARRREPAPVRNALL